MAIDKERLRQAVERERQRQSRPATLDDRVRDILRAAIEQHGKDCVADADRCESILRGLFGDGFQRELQLLVGTQRLGVAQELARADSTESRDVRVARLATNASGRLGIEASDALWAVDAWANAVQASASSSSGFGLTCPACRGSVDVMQWWSREVSACPRCAVRLRLAPGGEGLELAPPQTDSGPPVASAPRDVLRRSVEAARRVSEADPGVATAGSVTLSDAASQASSSSRTFGIIALAALLGVPAWFAWRHVTSDRPASPVVVAAPPPSTTKVDSTVRRPQSAPAARPETPNASPAAPATAPEAGPRMSSADINTVVAANEQSILAVLGAAQTLNRDEVGQLARAAGRSYDFAPRVAAISRDRKTARMLNKQSLEQWSKAFESPQGAAELVSPQAAALAADPFDVEVASNLAIVHFRAGNVDDAYRYAVYSMSLPRDADKEGRTADWNTLAAVFSARGQDDLAKNALLVTLTLTSNNAKRCEAAIHAVRHTYGAVLRIPTEHMFQIASERGLAAGVPECALPIAW